MSFFWKIQRSNRTAFILSDLTIVDYEELAHDIESFTKRLKVGRGLIEICCDGSYRQYVAYLASLNAKCPIILKQSTPASQESPFSVLYRYQPISDELTIEPLPYCPELNPDLAVLLSTSGSTGTAKSVRLSYANLSANATSIAEYLDLGDGDRAPMVLPFQYSYGMSVVNSHLHAGGSLVLSKGSVIDESFWTNFRRSGCTSLAGVPHSFELLDQERIKTHDLEKLRYMTQAGGKLAPSKVKYWANRAENEGWRFFVMYGQTEAGPRISYLPPELAAVNPASIGIPIPGGRMFIVDEDGNTLPDNQKGELVYQGPNTMMGYAVQDTDLCLSQGPDLLQTGDLALKHPNGLFEIVGRKSRFVKLFGYRIGLDSVEQKLLDMGIEAVCGAQGDSLYVLASFDPQDSQFTSDIATLLANWLEIPAAAFNVRHVNEIPRLPNGKVDAKKVTALVAEYADGQVGQSISRSKNLGSRLLNNYVKLFSVRQPQSVREIFANNFPNQAISDSSSFSELGGDSLSHLSVSLDLEKSLGDLPSDWGDRTVTELEGRARSSKLLASIETTTVVRAMAITFIVMNHFNFFEYGGGGPYGLFMVSGWAFAAFSIPNIISRNTSIPAFSLIIRIAFLTLGSVTVTYLVTGYGEWRSFLFVSNWVGPRAIEGAAWFVEVYLQILVAITIILAFPVCRDILRRNGFVVSALLASIFVVVAAISDQLIDTRHLYNRLPHLMAWMFLCGVAARLAATKSHLIIVSAIFVSGWLQDSGTSPSKIFFPLAALAIIWLPTVKIPRILLAPLRNVAAASLVIYLTHFQFSSIASKTVSEDTGVAVALALLGGVVLWRLYEPIDRLIKTSLEGLPTSNRSQSIN